MDFLADLLTVVLVGKGSNHVSIDLGGDLLTVVPLVVCLDHVLVDFVMLMVVLVVVAQVVPEVEMGTLNKEVQVDLVE